MKANEIDIKFINKETMEETWENLETLLTCERLAGMKKEDFIFTHEIADILLPNHFLEGGEA